MKAILTTIFILLSVAMICQPQPAEVTLADGSTFEGFADITKDDIIEFRMSLSDEPANMDGLDLKRVAFLEYPYDVFEYVFIKRRFKLLKLVAEGSINAYAQYPESFSTQKSDAQKKRENYINHDKKIFGNGVTTYSRGGFKMRKRRYWLKNMETGKVDDIRLNFRKEAEDWFKNCPELVGYIQNKEWTYSDMIKIIQFYNEFCGEV